MPPPVRCTGGFDLRFVCHAPRRCRVLLGALRDGRTAAPRGRGEIAMSEVKNRAARRAAGMHKADKPKAGQGGSAAAPHLYPDIPAIEEGHEFYPLKAFA